MKKLISFFIGIIMIFGWSIATSCSSDDDTMSGVYGYVEGNNNGSCYNFINHNTVVYYPNSTLSYTASGYVGNSWWSLSGNGKTYTYTFEDNKIYIPQKGIKGTILTKSGEVLIEDGSSIEYRKNLKPQ